MMVALAHARVVPKRMKVLLKQLDGERAQQRELESFAKKIRAALDMVQTQKKRGLRRHDTATTEEDDPQEKKRRAATTNEDDRQKKKRQAATTKEKNEQQNKMRRPKAGRKKQTRKPTNHFQRNAVPSRRC